MSCICICDRCDRKINGNYNSITANSENIYFGTLKRQSYDLCHNCWEEFVSFMDAAYRKDEIQGLPS